MVLSPGCRERGTMRRHVSGKSRLRLPLHEHSGMLAVNLITITKIHRETLMHKALLVAAALLLATHAVAQSALPAVDVTAAEIKAFIDALPKDAISDRPIRVVTVGNGKAGVYGVFRPQSLPGDAIRHDTSVTEIYYMLEGSATLVTGGTITDEVSSGNSPNTQRPNYRGSAIAGGVSRKIAAGDVVIIPPNVPHWWSSLDSDIRYLIFRPDPEGLQPVR